jgi:hypothetical protein
VAAVVARIIITKVTNPDEVGRQLEASMSNLGSAIARRMQRLVPKLTWALHDTIATDTSVDGATVTTVVGAGGGDVDYALHVELGTSRAGAQPYMRPALLQSRAGDLKSGGGTPARHGVVAVARPARRSR